MSDNLARFPTPQEAFKQSRRPAHVSPAFDSVGNIPIPPQPGRHRDYAAAGPGEYHSQPSTPEHQHREARRNFSGPNSSSQYTYSSQVPSQGSYPSSRTVHQSNSQQFSQSQQPQPQGYQPLAHPPQQAPLQGYHSSPGSRSASGNMRQPPPPGSQQYHAPPPAHHHHHAPPPPLPQQQQDLRPQSVPRNYPEFPDRQPYAHIDESKRQVPRRPVRVSPPPENTGLRSTSSSSLPTMGSSSASSLPVGGPKVPPAQPLEVADLRTLFDEVDRRKRGYLTERELSKALVNGDYTLFDTHTVRLMMKMFDRDGDGAIYFADFGQLWKYLHDWRQVFDRFDISRSDSIDFDEFCRALAAFGYTLTSSCVRFLFNAGSRLNRQGQRQMSFDLFVQSCISIKSITDTFKRYDTDRDGYITMGFEEFLIETTKLH